jgi:DNA-binding IclR family transcriptional regulator
VTTHLDQKVPKADPKASEADGPGVRSVDRAVDLLDSFDRDHPAWTLRALSQRCGLPKTTAIRLVAALEQRGLLWHRRDGAIALGPGLLRWAGLAESAWQIEPRAIRVMQDLCTETRETVNLYVRSGTARVCIAQQPGPQSLRQVVAVGDTLPLWAGAAGRILLIGCDESLMKAVARISPDGLGGLVRLKGLIRRAERDGFAVTHGEREMGASGIASPVRGPSGQISAALAVGGPTGRFKGDRVAAMVTTVVGAADSLAGLAVIGSDAVRP